MSLGAVPLLALLTAAGFLAGRTAESGGQAASTRLPGREVAARAQRPKTSVAGAGRGRESRWSSSVSRSRPGSARGASLSIAQLAGQRIIYAYAGLQPPADLLYRIHAGEAAGVIFFASNVVSGAQLRGVVSVLQRANASSPVHVPLLMLVDQEGGLVRRLPGAPALSEAQIGASRAAASLASASGAGAGANLRQAGISVNLAPVLDVARSRSGFDQVDGRSYGPNASLDSALGTAFIAAQQRTGVAATAKHFPGLGTASAAQDTDAGPVTLDEPLGELRAVEEAPFGAAISAGVKLVMVSWATYPALDPSRPAGLSPLVIGGELRGRLGFTGVTVSDSLAAGALALYGSVSVRGELAAEAGADLLLASARLPSENSPSEGVSVLHRLATALSTGRLTVTADERSLARVLALREQP